MRVVVFLMNLGADEGAARRDIRALEAAARAEVIHEVEAVIAERRSAGRESVYDFCAHEDALAQHILRALSQGGEGK